MKKIHIINAIGLLVCLFVTSCDDFVKIDPPRNALVTQTVFDNDQTANAAVADIYYQMANGFANGSFRSISAIGALSSDEFLSYYPSSVSIEAQQFNDNQLLSNNTFFLYGLWQDLYKYIYKANAVIEGLQTSTGVTESVKNRLTGEAKFIRAFSHFYLVNLWGNVPLVTTTDYRSNGVVERADQADVYEQIISDLLEAQNLLPDDYSLYTNQRVRVNKGAATAMLARVYLYTGDWANAETQATTVISNATLYALTTDLALVFRNTGKEAIFQLWSTSFPNDRTTFSVPATGPIYTAMRPELASSFEVGDQRWVKWGRSRVVNTVTYYYTVKYLSFSIPPLDYSTVLRLAEQYLIRAEARAQLNNVSGAQADINAIRTRAGLANTAASDQASLLLAIEQERKVELFSEWGHRWFDLKRTDRSDAVLGPLKTQWQSTDVLFPIPEAERIVNTKLTQNLGY
jgi:hypothetical protein